MFQLINKVVMAENDETPKDVAPTNNDTNVADLNKIEPDPYPNQEKTEGADNEQFIINNSNGNGINPNPTESGNDPNWIDGRKQNDDYVADATD